VCRLALQIGDKLWGADDILHLEEILTILTSENVYTTADERTRILNALPLRPTVEPWADPSMKAPKKSNRKTKGPASAEPSFATIDKET
jgi:hypothetical protein